MLLLLNTYIFYYNLICSLVITHIFYFICNEYGYSFRNIEIIRDYYWHCSSSAKKAFCLTFIINFITKINNNRNIGCSFF